MGKSKKNVAVGGKSSRKGDSPAKTNAKTRLAIAGAVVVIAALVVIIIILLRKGEEAPTQRETVGSGARGVVATSENMQEIADSLSKPVPDGYYMTKMNFEWEFEKWNIPSKRAYVENSVKNTRTVYFDLVLDETGELLYSSPFIPVGERHQNFALEKELAAGEYPATVTYHLVDDDNNEITTLSVRIKLKVLE